MCAQIEPWIANITNNTTLTKKYTDFSHFQVEHSSRHFYLICSIFAMARNTQVKNFFFFLQLLAYHRTGPHIIYNGMQPPVKWPFLTQLQTCCWQPSPEIWAEATKSCQLKKGQHWSWTSPKHSTSNSSITIIIFIHHHLLLRTL